jgi:hypothetical protein
MHNGSARQEICACVWFDLIRLPSSSPGLNQQHVARQDGTEHVSLRVQVEECRKTTHSNYSEIDLKDEPSTSQPPHPTPTGLTVTPLFRLSSLDAMASSYFLP